MMVKEYRDRWFLKILLCFISSFVGEYYLQVLTYNTYYYDHYSYYYCVLYFQIKVTSQQSR